MALGIWIRSHAGHFLVREGVGASAVGPRLGASDGWLRPPPSLAVSAFRPSPKRSADTFLPPQEFDMVLDLVCVRSLTGTRERSHWSTFSTGTGPIRRPDVPDEGCLVDQTNPAWVPLNGEALVAHGNTSEIWHLKVAAYALLTMG